MEHDRRSRMMRRSCRRAAAPAGLSLALVDSEVSAADLTEYTFSGLTLGSGLIIIAGAFRSGTATTISSLTVAGISATVDVTVPNGTTATFIAHAVNAAATGDVVLTFTGGAARAGISIYLATGYTEAAPYLTGTATRVAAAGAFSPSLTGEISSGFVIGSAFNGLSPGHRIAAGSKIVSAQTNYTVTANCQAGSTSWSAGLDAGIDTQMEATGTSVVQAACAAAFR